jgi:hypothetical protein
VDTKRRHQRELVQIQYSIVLQHTVVAAAAMLKPQEIQVVQAVAQVQDTQ